MRETTDLRGYSNALATALRETRRRLAEDRRQLIAIRMVPYV